MDYVYPTLVDYDLSDDSMRSSIVNQFPAVMNNDDESNNQKILNLFADFTIEQKNNLLYTFDQLRLQGASGGNLTQLAKKWGVNRIDDDDDFLRFQINVKIFQKRFGATEYGTKQFIAHSLDIDINSFQILPSDDKRDLYINDLPFAFKDDDKKEIKQAILFKSVQDNIPPTFRLNRIVYAINSTLNLQVGASGATFAVHDERNKRNRDIEDETILDLGIGDGGNNNIIDAKKKFNRNINNTAQTQIGTADENNTNIDEPLRTNRFIYDPRNGLHVATATEVGNIITGRSDRNGND